MGVVSRLGGGRKGGGGRLAVGGWAKADKDDTMV